MKRVLIFIGLVTLSYVYVFSQTEQTDGLIPQLQYDQDFMVYTEFSMLDGFNVVKQIRGLMKFTKGQKIYAIEVIKYNGNKVKSKTTYFYDKDQPIAISVESKGVTKVYYISNGNVVAFKKFEQAEYKPYGGMKNLNMAEISASAKVSQPNQKIMKLLPTLLSDVQDASYKLLNYRF